MIYPIVIYGSPVLRNVSVDITPDYPNLKQLVEDMFLTLTEAEGVGLAAPQIGKNIRLFTQGLQAGLHQRPDIRAFGADGSLQRGMSLAAGTA